MWKVVIVSGRDMDVEDKKATVLRNWTDRSSTLQNMNISATSYLKVLSQCKHPYRKEVGFRSFGPSTSNDGGPVISLLTLSSGNQKGEWFLNAVRHFARFSIEGFFKLLYFKHRP